MRCSTLALDMAQRRIQSSRRGDCVAAFI